MIHLKFRLIIIGIIAAVALGLAWLLTTDNPRSEDPLAILREVQRGILPGTDHEVIPDRREAIRRGLQLAGPGEVLVVAGRGHERYQVVGSERRPFQDRQVIAEELEQLER